MRFKAQHSGTKIDFRRFSSSDLTMGRTQGEAKMLNWVLTFLVVALVAAVFGFGGIAGSAVEIAKMIFYVAIIMFVISAVLHLANGRSPPLP
jgi:uncharacterized membrane protein YtjA (UPF0391 family)